MEFDFMLVVYPIVALVALFLIIKIINLRVVVPPDEVHIVQSARATKSYGRSRTVQVSGDGEQHTTQGNTYYAWPSWIPGLGVKVSKLLVSIFQLNLQDYIAYDKDRVPFELDLTAFFRIFDTNMAAERVKNIDELKVQLVNILQGSARKILANAPIDGPDGILGNRSIFGEEFTKEVKEQLKDWGTIPVKNIELMDIRDIEGSTVIHNIQAIKQSEISKMSRIAVADNGREASEREIEAQRQVDIASQEAEEQVGIRTADKTAKVGIAEQKSKQNIADEAKTTAEKNMAVVLVNQVRQADIDKEVQVVKANQAKEVKVIDADAAATARVREAEGSKDAAVAIATGDKEAKLLAAVGIEAVGRAEGAAETARLLAPVTTQAQLAKDLGDNKPYVEYLVNIKQIDANQAVGIAQAQALKEAMANADIKVIANTGANGGVNGGINSVKDLFSSSGGTSLGAMLEAIQQTPQGKRLFNILDGGKGDEKAA